MPLNPSIKRYNERQVKERFYDDTYYRFTIGQTPFPVPAEVADALAVHRGDNDYTTAEGIPELRSTIARWHNTFDEMDITADQVLVGPGSKALVANLMLVWDNPVLIPTPAWMSYAPLAGFYGRDVKFIHTREEDQYFIDPERLARATADHASRLLIFNNPHNPSGLLAGDAYLKDLATVCRQNNITVLADEIYARLYSGFRSFWHYYPEGTIISSGLSKWCGAGGWRFGVFITPQVTPTLRDYLIAAGTETYSSVAHPIQQAARAAYNVESQALTQYRQQCRDYYQNMLAYAVPILDEVATFPWPTDGYYLFLNFRQFREHFPSGLALSEYLLQHKISVLPGEMFGRPPEELTIRVCLVDTEEKTREGVQKLAEAMKAVW